MYFRQSSVDSVHPVKKTFCLLRSFLFSDSINRMDRIDRQTHSAAPLSWEMLTQPYSEYARELKR